MNQNRGLLIGIGCAVALILALCIGGIVAMALLGPALGNTIALFDTTDVPQIGPTKAPVDVGTPTAPEFTLGDMEALIKEHDGKDCPDSDALTCITLTMPLDHNDSSNTKTVDVVFGIHPASGERFGMFVQAFPGGPGGAGIGSADGRVDRFDEKILEHYDIVFFDQRGVGLSSPLDCDKALEEYFSDSINDYNTEGDQGPDTPDEQEKVIEQSRTFTDDCVKEIGIEPAELKLYDTNQVIEDLDNFREAVGDDKFYLYGVSYGTEVAQMYAAVHADHLAGMVLDGVVDLTINGQTADRNQTRAFAKALSATLDACNSDNTCRGDFGGDNAQQAYDDLIAKVAEKPVDVEFPLPDGSKASRILTVEKVEATATFSMYSTAARMIFLRSLAAAHHEDYVPMLRLLYALQDMDPKTERFVGDPNFSYTDFFIVNCADNSYYTGTAEERIAALMKDSEESYGLKERLDEGMYGDIVCILWPDSPSTDSTLPPLEAPGVPTLVLNATLDPATPYEAGKSVASHLDDGYHIYVDGGEHGSYLSNEACPDNYVTNLLINGTLPDEKEIKCTWAQPIMWDYQAPGLADASGLQVSDLPQFLATTLSDIVFTPEVLFDSGNEGEISLGCPYGGTLSFEMDKKTTIEHFTFTDCEYTSGFAMTGTGIFDFEKGDRGLDIDVSGNKSGHLKFDWVIDPASITLTGDYGGEKVSFVR